MDLSQFKKNKNQIFSYSVQGKILPSAISKALAKYQDTNIKSIPNSTKKLYDISLYLFTPFFVTSQETLKDILSSLLKVVCLLFHLGVSFFLNLISVKFQISLFIMEQLITWITLSKRGCPLIPYWLSLEVSRTLRTLLRYSICWANTDIKPEWEHHNNIRNFCAKLEITYTNKSFKFSWFLPLVILSVSSNRAQEPDWIMPVR